MRRLGWILGFALLAAACGDDDDGGDGTTADAAPTADAPQAGADAGDEADAAAGEADAAVADGGAPNTAPQIMQVMWGPTPTPACMTGIPHQYTITITATDAETPGTLTYSGSVAGCTGVINSASAMVNCPNAAPYSGSVTVADPGGLTDTQTFTINICQSGSAP